VNHREYLFSLELLGIKLGLAQMRALVGQLGRPEQAFRSIIVAGTNGKGSVTAIVEHALRAAGYRTGRYTSPHLVDLEERIAIEGHPIARGTLERLAGRVREAAGQLPAPPSFFEATTAVALEAFRDAEVDIAVLEVGLGGRLDATNVVDAIAAAITSIDFDHEAFLGHSLEDIAREKAGVTRRGAVAVLASNPPVVRDVIQRHCERTGARFVYAPDRIRLEVAMHEGVARISLVTPHGSYDEVTLGLRGRHQVDNAVEAVRLLEDLAAHGTLPVGPEAIRTALEAVRWPARLELLSWHGHDVLLDGAHNPAGARALAAFLAESYGRPLPLVVAAMRDKNLTELVRALLPAASHVIFTAPATARAATPGELLAVATTLGTRVPYEAIDSPMDALARATTLGEPAVVAGSLYLAGEIRAEIS
jgi:dihydrofolate synthase/folylpolyglutamate synthase